MGVRILLIAAAVSIADTDLVELAALHDGEHYQRFAEALRSPEGLADLEPVTRRLAPGYPVVIAAVSLLVPMPVAALLVSILAAGGAVLFFGQSGARRSTVALFAVFTPSWLVFSSTAMSEGLFLALVLAGVVLWRRQEAEARTGARAGAALLLAAATLVRPVGALVFAPLFLVSLRPAPMRSSVATLAAYALPLLAWAAFATVLWGSPVVFAHAYLDKDFALPFASLVEGLARPHLDLLKTGQVLFVLALAVGSLVGLVRAWRARRDRRRLEDAGWLASHLSFYLFLPSAWVFECLPRFLVSCLPPTLVGLDRWLPRRVLAVSAIGAVSWLVCLYWTVRALSS
jgi:hypothetical protein